MMEEKLIWTDPEWRQEAEAWIDARLKAERIERLGEVEQPHVRPWSTVLRVPTGRGSFYFKALPPSLRYEVAVVQELGRRFAGRVPRLLAADPERGWMLQHDGGELLRQRLQRKPGLQEWHILLEIYADVQNRLAPQVEDLLALGVPDRRPEKLPELLADLLGDPDALHLDHPDGLSEASLAALRAARPKIEVLCERLSQGPVPAALDHGDLHDANVFWSDGGPVIFDWGDCSVAHPFTSLRTVHVSLENTLGWEEEDPRIQQLTDRYLEYWTDSAPLPALRRCFAAAAGIAPLVAALRWHRALQSLPSGQQAYVEPVPGLLEELLANLRKA